MCRIQVLSSTLVQKDGQARQTSCTSSVPLISSADNKCCLYSKVQRNLFINAGANSTSLWLENVSVQFKQVEVTPPSCSHLCLPPLQFLLLQPPLCPSSFSSLPCLWWRGRQRWAKSQAQLSDREKCWRRQKREQSLLSPSRTSPTLHLSFLSLRTGQVPTSMYFTVWLGGHRERWPIMRGVMSLRPCSHSLACQANDDDDDNEKKEEEEEEKGGALRNLAQLLAL